MNKRIERLYRVVYRALYRVDSNLGYQRTIEALTLLSNAIDEHDGDIDWFIGEGTECTLDSLLVGAYWFCVDWHGGMSSPEYACQCAIGAFFDPGMTSLEDDTCEHDVYQALEQLCKSYLSSC